MVDIVGTVVIEPEEYFFQGLARQNMPFHQAVAELIDNAIAASEIPFKVHVHLKETSSGEITVIVVDHGRGISLERLRNGAFRPGGIPDSANRLNEHGFGPKNALCSLTRNQMPFVVKTRDAQALDSGHFYRVMGPFKQGMEVEQLPQSDWPSYGSPTTGTIVTATTLLPYVQTVQQSRGRRATNLATLTQYLSEHIGLLYRHYLGEVVPRLGTARGTIHIHQGGEVISVEARRIPMVGVKRDDIKVSAGGVNFACTYERGVLDESERDRAGFHVYYQGNIPTQGIDVTIGGRTVAVHQLNEIWELDRHNAYNSFVGELRVPEDVPKEHLRTVNNKSNFDNQDPVWNQIFDELRTNYQPTREPGAQSERELRQRLADFLRTFSGARIVEPYSVWGGAGVEIDVFQENERTGEIIIYEIKVGRAQPQFIYQLKMYWDGLVLDGKTPTTGILVCSGWDTGHQFMIDQIRDHLQDPSGKAYNFQLRTHEQMKLR